MSQSKKKKTSEEELLELKRQAMVAERLRFEAIRNTRLKRDPLRLDLLALGVAHEFNNIIGAAEGHAEWALDSEDKEDMRDALKVILLACRRSTQVTKALQGLIQPKEELKKIFKVKEVLEDVKVLFSAKLKKLGVRLDFTNEDLSLYGNTSQILEVFLNLIKNSCDAFEEEGLSKEKHIHIKFEKDENQEDLKILYEDNGPGISQSHYEMMFQPFFTTKGVFSSALAEKLPADRGPAGEKKFTGLGLYLCRSIIQEHGGSIELVSGENGAQFEIILPCIEE